MCQKTIKQQLEKNEGIRMTTKAAHVDNDPNSYVFGRENPLWLSADADVGFSWN